MKRTYLFGTMVAFSLAAASVGAQQDRPTPSSSDRADKNVVVTGCLKSGSQIAGATGSGSTGTGTAGTSGTSGTSASASGRSSGFILTDAKLTPGSGASASATGTGTSATGTGSTASGTTGSTSTGATAGTSGTSASGSASADSSDKGKSFALVGGQQSELQGYVNSKVEIRGTLDSSASSSSASGSSTTGATGSTATGSTAGTAPTGATASGTGSMSGMSHAGDHQQLRVTSVRQLASSCDSGQ